MIPVIILFVNGVIEAAFTGPDALRHCFQIAQTYEVPAQCVSETSEGRPYLGLEFTLSPRPKPRPQELP